MAEERERLEMVKQARRAFPLVRGDHPTVALLKEQALTAKLAADYSSAEHPESPPDFDIGGRSDVIHFEHRVGDGLHYVNNIRITLGDGTQWLGSTSEVSVLHTVSRFADRELRLSLEALWNAAYPDDPVSAWDSEFILKYAYMYVDFRHGPPEDGSAYLSLLLSDLDAIGCGRLGEVLETKYRSHERRTKRLARRQANRKKAKELLVSLVYISLVATYLLYGIFTWLFIRDASNPTVPDSLGKALSVAFVVAFLWPFVAGVCIILWTEKPGQGQIVITVQLLALVCWATILGTKPKDDQAMKWVGDFIEYYKRMESLDPDLTMAPYYDVVTMAERGGLRRIEGDLYALPAGYEYLSVTESVRVLRSAGVTAILFYAFGPGQDAGEFFGLLYISNDDPKSLDSFWQVRCDDVLMPGWAPKLYLCGHNVPKLEQLNQPMIPIQPFSIP